MSRVVYPNRFALWFFFGVIITSIFFYWFSQQIVLEKEAEVVSIEGASKTFSSKISDISE